MTVTAGMTASKSAPQAFAEPWHAEVFALTMDLSDNGHFTWSEWTKAFGARLKAAAVAGGPTDGSDYYDVWLETLETFLAEKNLLTPAAVTAARDAWADAYRSTPHGAPVQLKL